MSKLLVLGIGNMLLTDDGVGVFAAQKLLEETWPEHIAVREGGTFTQDIFYSFGGYSHLLVLDVVHAGGEPGSLYRLEEDALVKDEKQRLSIHDIDLLDSLRMAELYFKSRPRMRVLGMEPADYTTWNIGLSPACEAAFPAYMDMVRSEIAAWIAATGAEAESSADAARPGSGGGHSVPAREPEA